MTRCFFILVSIDIRVVLRRQHLCRCVNPRSFRIADLSPRRRWDFYRLRYASTSVGDARLTRARPVRPAGASVTDPFCPTHNILPIIVSRATAIGLHMYGTRHRCFAPVALDFNQASLQKGHGLSRRDLRLWSVTVHRAAHADDEPLGLSEHCCVRVYRSFVPFPSTRRIAYAVATSARSVTKTRALATASATPFQSIYDRGDR